MHRQQVYIQFERLVGWSLTSLFSTNAAISEKIQFELSVTKL